MPTKSRTKHETLTQNFNAKFSDYSSAQNTQAGDSLMDDVWPNKVMEAKAVCMIQGPLCSLYITKKKAHYFKENISLRKVALVDKWNKTDLKWYIFKPSLRN